MEFVFFPKVYYKEKKVDFEEISQNAVYMYRFFSLIRKMLALWTFTLTFYKSFNKI